MAASARNAKRVVAVISAYHPTEALVEHCRTLAAQVSHIVVIDDGSGSQVEPILHTLEAAGVRVERMQQNSGIGAAINRGYAIAREYSPEFIVTFDQDSAAPEGFVDALVNEYDRLHTTGLRVGMVAPDHYSQTSQSQLSADGEHLEAVAPIQSGLLMPLSAIDELGPQREDFFIDLIDTEYFFRAKQAGFVAACVPGLTLPHGFGHRLYVHVLGKRLTKANGGPRMVSVSTPFRYYYRARNRILLNREFKKTRDIKKVLRRQTRNDLVLDFGVAIYSAQGKWALIQIIAAGWFDGFRGRSGKIPATVMNRAKRVTWQYPVTGSSELTE